MLNNDVTMVDACTRHGKGGSPTAVLIDDAARSDGARQAIVRQAGTSHAAFIDPGFEITAESASSVRFFTADGELKNCGHGTIAAQAVLLERRAAEQYQGQQRTRGPDLRDHGQPPARRHRGLVRPGAGRVVGVRR